MTCFKVAVHCCIALPMVLCISIASAGGGHSCGLSGGAGVKAANHTSAAYMAYAAAAISNARTCGRNTTARVSGPAAAPFDSHYRNSSYFSNHSRQLSKTSPGKMAKTKAVKNHTGHLQKTFPQVVPQSSAPASSPASSKERHLMQGGIRRTDSQTRHQIQPHKSWKSLSSTDTQAIQHSRAVHPKEWQRQKRAGDYQTARTTGVKKTKRKSPKAALPTLKSWPHRGKQGAVASAIYYQSDYEPYSLDYDDQDTGLEQDIQHLTLQTNQQKEAHLKEQRSPQENQRQDVHADTLPEGKFYEEQPASAQSDSQLHPQYQQGWQDKAAQMALMALASLSTNHPIYPLVAASGLLGLNLHAAGAQQAPMLTETPQNITQPCCSPAVFNCSGEGITIVWSVILPGSSTVHLVTDPLIKEKGITTSLVLDNGHVSNELSVPTHIEGLNGLQARCMLYPGGFTSNFATLTIESGLGAAQNLKFGDTFSVLTWEEAQAAGLSGTPAYSVTVRDLTLNQTLVNLSGQPCCTIHLPLLETCHSVQGAVTSLLGNHSGPTVTIDKRTPGEYLTVQDVLLDTSSNSTTDYLQILLQQRGYIPCPTQKLKVSYGETEASQYQTYLMERVNTLFTIEFPTHTKSNNYTVTAIILDELGNPQHSYTESVSTPPEATTTGSTTPTQIILSTLTQTPGSSDLNTQPTTIKLSGSPPTPAHLMPPSSIDEPSESGGSIDTSVPPPTQIILATQSQAPVSSDPGTQPTITLKLFSITPTPAHSMPPSSTDETSESGGSMEASVAAITVAAATTPTHSMSPTDGSSEPGSIGAAIIGSSVAAVTAATAVAATVAVVVIVKKRADSKPSQSTEAGAWLLHDVEMSNAEINNLEKGLEPEPEDQQPAGISEENTAL